MRKESEKQTETKKCRVADAHASDMRLLRDGASVNEQEVSINK